MIAGASASSERPVPKSPSERAGERAGTVSGQDPQDRDPRLKRRDRLALTAHPVLQLLPVTERHLAIDLAGTAPGGRIALLVRTDLTLAYARRAYRQFLGAHDDTGRGYAVTFRRV
jgi:hypothetical protein